MVMGERLQKPDFAKLVESKVFERKFRQKIEKPFTSIFCILEISKAHLARDIQLVGNEF